MSYCDLLLTKHEYVLKGRLGTPQGQEYNWRPEVRVTRTPTGTPEINKKNNSLVFTYASIILPVLVILQKYTLTENDQ